MDETNHSRRSSRVSNQQNCTLSLTEEARKLTEKIKQELADHQTALEQDYADLEYLRIWTSQKLDLLDRTIQQLGNGQKSASKAGCIDDLLYLKERVERLRQ